MNDLREAFDGDGSEDELVEIDWAPLQAAIDAMAEEGLDLDDGEDLINHWAALLGVLLRKVRGDEQLSEDELAELAAEAAAFAVDLAVSEENLPELTPSGEQRGN